MLAGRVESYIGRFDPSLRVSSLGDAVTQIDPRVQCDLQVIDEQLLEFEIL